MNLLHNFLYKFAISFNALFYRLHIPYTSWLLVVFHFNTFGFSFESFTHSLTHTDTHTIHKATRASEILAPKAALLSACTLKWNQISDTCTYSPLPFVQQKHKSVDLNSYRIELNAIYDQSFKCAIYRENP